jgi:hypothetical protein
MEGGLYNIRGAQQLLNVKNVCAIILIIGTNISTSFTEKWTLHSRLKYRSRRRQP